LNDSDVVAYLRGHPDFLVRHPEALEFLQVPHGCGEAVSLVEYQAGALRQQSHDLRTRMRDLVQAARGNETLGRQVHDLTLGLIDCHALDEVSTRLAQSLKDDFKVDMAALRLLVAPRDPSDRAMSEFADDAVAQRALFDNALSAGQPVCGRVPEAQARALFGARAADLGSGSLLPLGGARRLGVLAICARDEQRYHPGMGTTFLRRIAQAVTCAIAPYLLVE